MKTIQCKYFDWLYKILIIYVYFNEILSKSKMELLTGLKYPIVLILAFLLWNKGKKLKKFFYTKGFRYFYLYIILISFITSPLYLTYGYTGIGSLKNLIFLPISVYLFTYYEEVTGKTMSSLLAFCLNVAVAHVVLNTFFYFVELPIWKTFHPYWGRISQGYPTIDVVTLSFSLAICLICNSLKWTICKRLCYALILVVGIGLLASGTGLVMLVVIFFGAFFTSLAGKNSKKQFMVSVSAFFIISVCFSFSIQIIKLVDSTLYEEMYLSVQNRFAILTGGKSEMDVNTMEVREERRKRLSRFLTSPIDKICGTGFAHVDMNPTNERNVGNAVFLEDQYSVNLLTIGYIGTVLYFGFLLIDLLACFKRKENLRGLIIGLFLISTFTSGCLINYSIAIFTGLFLNKKFIDINSRKNEIIKYRYSNL